MKFYSKNPSPDSRKIQSSIKYHFENNTNIKLNFEETFRIGFYFALQVLLTEDEFLKEQDGIKKLNKIFRKFRVSSKYKDKGFGDPLQDARRCHYEVIIEIQTDSRTKSRFLILKYRPIFE